MEKDIKDYLHLYMGSKLVGFTSAGVPDEAFTYEVDHSTYLVFMSGQMKGNYRLALRPPSDMTEEEAIELARLSEYEQHFNDVKVERTKFNDLLVSWQGVSESRECFNATGEMFWCPEQFQWLLQKGFDLFELIFYGIAIDKTTITS